MAWCFRVDCIIQCLLVFLQVFSFYVLHINFSPCHNYPNKGGVISPQALHSLMQHLQNFRGVRMHPCHFYDNNKNGIEVLYHNPTSVKAYLALLFRKTRDMVHMETERIVWQSIISFLSNFSIIIVDIVINQWVRSTFVLLVSNHYNGRTCNLLEKCEGYLAAHNKRKLCKSFIELSWCCPTRNWSMYMYYNMALSTQEQKTCESFGIPHYFRVLECLQKPN